MLEDEVVLSSLQETKNVIAAIATKVSKSLFNKFGKAVVYDLGRSSTPFYMGIGSGLGNLMGLLNLLWPRPLLTSSCEKEDTMVWLPHPNRYSVHSAWEAIRLKLASKT